MQYIVQSEVLMSNLKIMFVEGNGMTHWLSDDGGKKGGLQDPVQIARITQVTKFLILEN